MFGALTAGATPGGIVGTYVGQVRVGNRAAQLGHHAVKPGLACFQRFAEIVVLSAADLLAQVGQVRSQRLEDGLYLVIFNIYLHTSASSYMRARLCGGL